MAKTFLSLLLLLTFHLPLCFSGESSSMESVPDLQNTMYNVVDGYPCVRLLNLSGTIGCSNPGRDKVVAPIVRFQNVDEISEPSAILVSENDFPSLFARISDDISFASKVGGVLVESGTDLQNKLKGFSPDQKFPQAEFAPYDNINYEWNPIGSGIMWKSYNFPVFLLTESGTKTLREFIIKNDDKSKSYISNVAEFDLVMQTMRSGTHDSESCLKEATCLPLGGYSVWSSLPPINVSSLEKPKSIILTVASMDSASFFRDKSLGADSPISGLIALLAAVDALSHVDGLGDLSKQLVFGVFTGEEWGYLGSRRFLLELDMHSDAVHGLDNSLFETVIEIGSVGKGFSQGANNFFAHTKGDSSATNQTKAALKHAQESLRSENIKITPASASNPGIPPSSLMVFSKKNPAISGVVLEDFDSVFVNKFYHSHLDDLSNVNSSAVVAAASLVARTLYILASETKDVQDSALTSINVNVSLVEQLMGCLLDCDPGLSCELVKKYISPASTCPSHYVGVIQDEPSSTPYAGYINDVPRFIWNFLADRTSISREHNDSSNCQNGCNGRDEVCIKAEIDGKGVCVLSTTRYVPAYSTRLKFESGVWNVLPTNSSDSMGVVDPVWTESNWNSISMRIYTIQVAAYDHLVLFVGVILTILAYLAITVTRALAIKAMKRD
ncbi:putative nicastrin [Lupinus albus]|uniref:Nicastrin n=1 Tax=Lupinus albus TaxID=3870 RepID=A0A6A4P2K3_LUPAL|nr:putative nicastrin [Lupinus albus]